jgi:hypothetical protein
MNFFTLRDEVVKISLTILLFNLEHYKLFFGNVNLREVKSTSLIRS